MTALRNHDVADMAERAAAEIESLRAHIDRIQPAADAYGAICSILDLLPKPNMGYGEDLAHRLRKQAEELRAQPVAKIEE